jgi:hypothetical protein
VIAGAKRTLIVQLFAAAPPANVVPHVPGLALEWVKSVLPLNPTAKPLRVGLFAGLVTVSVIVMLAVPRITPPKAVVNGATVIGAIPVPVTEMVWETPGAATRTLTTPVLAPAVEGFRAMYIVHVPPGARVVGCRQLPVPVTRIQFAGGIIRLTVKLANGLVFVTTTAWAALVVPKSCSANDKDEAERV